MPRSDLFAFAFVLGLAVAWLSRSLLDWWADRAPAPVEHEPEAIAPPPPIPAETLAQAYAATATALVEALWLTGYAAGYGDATRGARVSLLHVEQLREERVPAACASFVDRHGEILATAFVDGCNAFERGLRREGTFDDDSLDRAHALAWRAIAEDRAKKKPVGTVVPPPPETGGAA